MSRFTQHLIKRLQRSAGLQCSAEKEWMQFAKSTATKSRQRTPNRNVQGRYSGEDMLRPGPCIALNLNSCYPLKNVEQVSVGKTVTKKESYLSSRKRRSLVYHWTLGSATAISSGKWKQELRTVTRNAILFSDARGAFVTFHNSKFRASAGRSGQNPAERRQTYSRNRSVHVPRTAESE